eukprot:gene18923-20827_t
MPQKKPSAGARKKLTIKSKVQSSCNLFVNVPLTREKFCLSDIQLSTKIIDIKEKLELVAGIPTNLQRLQYLDKEDLLDHTDLRKNDIVPSGTLTLRIWRTWEKLVSDVCSGDIDGILNRNFIPVARPVDIDPALLRLKENDMKYRLSIALFIASHRGKTDLVGRLIDEGSDTNAVTKLGRTALHAAAASDSSKCIDLLLEKGASTEIMDNSGKTASSVANDYGNRGSEKKLFLFQWQKRAESANHKVTASKVMMHQQFDSGYPIWRKGKYQQVYLCKTLPVGEFIGTAINAPKTKSMKPPFQSLQKELAERRKEDIEQHGESFDADGAGSPGRDEQQTNTHLFGEKTKRGEHIFKSHSDWMMEKELVRKEQKLLDRLLKQQEEKLKPWEKETKHGKKIEGKVMSFQQWQEDKLKHKSQPNTQVNDEKPRRRIEVYEDYDLVPQFEKQFLQKVDITDNNLL